MNNEEKPWILYFNSRGDTIQIDQTEYEALIKALKEESVGTTLKDGSYINLRIASIVANPHYVSPESIVKGRKLRDLKNEYLFLKNQGVVSTKKEYITWKKKSIEDMKKFHEYIKGKGEGNEKNGTT